MIVLLSLMLVSCGAEQPTLSQAWLGDACGVPNLTFDINDRTKVLTLGEYQAQGSEMTPDGLSLSPSSDRQKLIERNLSCLEREAKRRGLTVKYPIVNVDA